MDRDTAIRFLVDAQGHSHGVLIDPELWGHVCAHVQAALDRLCPAEKVFPEPMADFELLKKYWDLRYELPTDVSCEACGQTTSDWQADDPRKFLLRAANMGGLLSFQCTACHARVTKRHFKDKVTVTCTPHLECACG
jgi:hypothetical protein